MTLFKLSILPSPQLAQLVANALAPLVRATIQKEVATMSANLSEAVAGLRAAAQAAEATIQSLRDQSAADKAAIADLQARLEQAAAGDPATVAAIDAVAAELNGAAVPAEPPVGEPDPAQS